MKIPKIYIITLLDKKDRQRKVHAQFQHGGLSEENWEFFYTKKLETLPTNFSSKLFHKRYIRNAALGEIGCTLSHRKIWKKVSSIENGFGIILEDDVSLENKFFEFIKDLQVKDLHKRFYNKSCIFLLGHSKTAKENLWMQRLKQPLIETTYLSNTKFGINSDINLCGTVGYLITSKAAKMLLKKNIFFNLADDFKYYHSKGVIVYHPKLPLVYEDLNENISSTGNEIKIFHKLYSRRIFFEIGKVILSSFRLLIYNFKKIFKK